MENKESPKTTGISEITGKTVKVRHATEADMIFIENNLRKHNLDTEDLDQNQFVVATENGDMIGFGRLLKVGRQYSTGCVTVVEDKEKLGIGLQIIKHLLEYSPVEKVYAPTELVEYFRELGFTVVADGSKGLIDALDEACRQKERRNAVLMVYEKT